MLLPLTFIPFPAVCYAPSLQPALSKFGVNVIDMIRANRTCHANTENCKLVVHALASVKLIAKSTCSTLYANTIMWWDTLLIYLDNQLAIICTMEPVHSGHPSGPNKFATSLLYSWLPKEVIFHRIALIKLAGSKPERGD